MVTIFLCAIGALVGLTFALFANVVILPRVLATLAERDRVWPPPSLVTTIYRYMFPLVFGSVGAMAAYYLFVA
jgi:hypothetical protein